MQGDYNAMDMARLKELSHPSKDDQLLAEAVADQMGIFRKPLAPGVNCPACNSINITGEAQPTIPLTHTCGKTVKEKLGEVQKTRQPTRSEIRRMQDYSKNYKKRNPRASLADVTKAVIKKFGITVNV